MEVRYVFVKDEGIRMKFTASCSLTAVCLPIAHILSNLEITKTEQVKTLLQSNPGDILKDVKNNADFVIRVEPTVDIDKYVIIFEDVNEGDKDLLLHFLAFSSSLYHILIRDNDESEIYKRVMNLIKDLGGG